MSRPSRRTRVATRITVPLTLALGVALVAPLSAAAFEPLEDYETISGWAGITVSADGTTAYLANDNEDSVTVVDLITMTTITSFGVGIKPTNTALSPDGSVGISSSLNSDEIMFFDPETNMTDGAPVVTGTWPSDGAFTADGSKVWVTNYGAGSISIVDVATRTVDTTFTGLGNPQDIELSQDGTVFWVADTSLGVFAFDASTHAMLDGLAVGGQPTSIRLTPDDSRAYVANQTANIVVVDTSDPTDLAALTPITTPIPTPNIDLSPDGSTLYAIQYDAVGDDDGVTRIDLASGTQNHVAMASPFRIAAMPTGNGLLVSQFDLEMWLVADPVVRLSGSNRYGTAVEISQEGFPGGSDVVYVATGLSFPDALAGGPGAAQLGGPVLLTDPVTLPAAVRAEVVRLDPDRIVVVGGTAQVSAAIMADLNTIAPTDRIAGADRFATSRQIAIDAFGLASGGNGATDVYVATGLNFPDALAAGAAGAALDRPVILVNGGLPTVDQATLDTLDDLGAVNIFVVGGSSVVSDGIVTQLGAARLAGSDRYSTAVAINQEAFGADSARRAIIATGLTFPDALAASALAGKIKAPLFLAQTNCVPASVLTELTTIGVSQVTLVGGTGPLTQSVFDLTPC
jgi:YVTN family beta-propeller protein